MRIEDKVLAIIQANTEEKASVTLTSDLRKELRLDSFGTLMIINAIEDAFGIAVDDADFGRANTIADVVALLQSKYHCN
jgi:acyl carrier protein